MVFEFMSVSCIAEHNSHYPPFYIYIYIFFFYRNRNIEINFKLPAAKNVLWGGNFSSVKIGCFKEFTIPKTTVQQHSI